MTSAMDDSIQPKPTSLTPQFPTDRIHSLDVMGGIVLLGILLMSIVSFGLYGSTVHIMKGRARVSG